MKITLKRVYNILLCIAVFVLGACLIAGALNIYYTGDSRDQIYTRDVVEERLAHYALPITLCSVIIIGSFIIDFFDPMPEPLSSATDYSFVKKALLRRRDPSCAEAEVCNMLKKEKNKRLILTAATVGLTLIGSVVFLIYALDPDSYHTSEINSSMIAAMKWLVPCYALPFIFGIAAAFLKDKSLKQEVEIIKKLPTAQGTKTEKKPGTLLLVIRIAIVAVAISVTLYGYFSGGTADVLTKAVNICTECIGLG